MSATKGGTPGDEFDSGAIAVTNASAYVDVCTIQANGRPVLILGTVGAGGAIAHLQVTQTPVAGGTHRVLAADADLAAGVAAIEYCLPAAAYQSAAGETFQLLLDSGAAEYTISAKKATSDTTVRIQGRVL